MRFCEINGYFVVEQNGLGNTLFGLRCDGRFRLSEEIRSGFRFEDRFGCTYDKR